MPSPTDDETPFPSLSHAATFNVFGRSHLSPQDAHLSPPRRARDFDGDGTAEMRGIGGGSDRSRSRRRKRAWKKLMWVKQSFPDNYTDQATFLENLQRNPRLKPYDFWPLVADSTVILQHVCSVTIFIVCFVEIYHERVSPVSVVSWSSFATFVGWILWERWVSEEEDKEDEANAAAVASAAATGNTAPAPVVRTGSVRRRNRAGSVRRPPHPLRVESLPSNMSTSVTPSSAAQSPGNSAASSTTNLHSNGSVPNGRLAPSTSTTSSRLTPKTSSEALRNNEPLVPLDENRTHQRLGTIKSALLIWSTLLGLSPILRSLTESTSSDSIWAISFWLLAINIFFFDYSGGVGTKFPASLSTNAALMASTVLASRLQETGPVFSLTLFSIEVFGLFPVFRRHIRHRSWKYHLLQTVILVVGSGFGVGMVVAAVKEWKQPWKSGIMGMIFSVVTAALATGGCSWWLIGLQKYKNEIRGPWDPARPIIMSRTRWDDR
ncbi:phosphatidylinositol N-acetylglucosaminyltransferase [Pochonia chlamydosporia 170]|uniref:Phosphatidylinositol N-acetylglucosaminyltransferase n=1 Tax=Pochonia chlamydosporia 170 TaxID=1380566 RepID=A0A179FP61_METCM|nr:phosphatidylinositol N-acetylglucosaminyltransferase [Pochonia chlamydosporia 170]OAQ67068.1 phosphatidylinositol N-acetylglucosaminyltransferase [Pochonia chlamydosporia 170]